MSGDYGDRRNVSHLARAFKAAIPSLSANPDGRSGGNQLRASRVARRRPSRGFRMPSWKPGSLPSASWRRVCNEVCMSPWPQRNATWQDREVPEVPQTPTCGGHRHSMTHRGTTPGLRFEQSSIRGDQLSEAVRLDPADEALGAGVPVCQFDGGWRDGVGSNLTSPTIRQQRCETRPSRSASGWPRSQTLFVAYSIT